MSARFQINALAIVKIYMATIYANVPRGPPATRTHEMAVSNQIQVTLPSWYSLTGEVPFIMIVITRIIYL